MKNKFSYYFLVAFVMLCPLFTGCYTYFGAEKGQALYRMKSKSPDLEEENYFEELIKSNVEQMQQDKAFKFMLAEDYELDDQGLDQMKKREVLKARVLLRFVWFSDVHIRQRELKVGSKLYSGLVDSFFPAAERNSVQEDFHWAVYLSLIEATNKLDEYFRSGPQVVTASVDKTARIWDVATGQEIHTLKGHTDRVLSASFSPDGKYKDRERGIDFMIHTGDSSDTGSIEELYQFIYISDRLKIPWLNVVGNHDVSIFGIYNPRLGYGKHQDVIYYPIGDLGDFIWMHRNDKGRQISGSGRYLLPTPAKTTHLQSIEPYLGKKLPETFYHGFDLKNAACSSRSNSERPRFESFEEAGYYCVDLCEKPIRIRLIALNSSKEDQMGAKGAISDRQHLWLEENLLPPGKGINLVFMHHGPKDLKRDFFSDKTHKLLKGPDTKTLVLFTGHSHEHKLIKGADPKEGGHYELNTGSVVEYPQIGRLIELRQGEKGEVFLISRALWNSYMAVREKDMPSSKKEDIEDFFLYSCRGEERNRKMENPGDAVRCGHYGAFADYLGNRRVQPSRVQPFKEIWNGANLILQIKP